MEEKHKIHWRSTMMQFLGIAFVVKMITMYPDPIAAFPGLVGFAFLYMAEEVRKGEDT